MKENHLLEKSGSDPKEKPGGKEQPVEALIKKAVMKGEGKWQSECV